jgi:hypothetical protein
MIMKILAIILLSLFTLAILCLVGSVAIWVATGDWSPNSVQYRMATAGGWAIFILLLIVGYGLMDG